MSDGLVRKTYPRPALMISRQGVLFVGALLAIAVVVAVITRKAPNEIRQAAQDGSKVMPSHVVSFLPTSYSDIPKERPIPTPAPINTPSLSDTDKLLAQALAERQKRADAARASPVTFQGLSISAPASSSRFDSPMSAGDPQRVAGAPNPRDNENRQDDKNTFLSGKRSNDTYLGDRLHSPRSKYELMSGTIIPGVLLTGLNSDLPGQILGQVSQNVYDTVSGNYLLVPQGAKVLGEYDSRIVFGQERLLIVWTRIIFPNGRSISLEGMPGVDLSGAAGLSDQVNNHYLRLITGVVLSSLLSASAQLAEGQTFNTVDPSYGQLAAQGAARNINDVGQQITRRNLAVQPTLEIRPGFRFNVFVHKDVILEPYDT